MRIQGASLPPAADAHARTKRDRSTAAFSEDLDQQNKLNSFWFGTNGVRIFTLKRSTEKEQWYKLKSHKIISYQKITTMIPIYYQIKKQTFSLYSPYYGERSNEFAVPISAS